MAHVATWKKDVVKDLTEQMTSHQVVAVVNLRGIPSAQLQKMRADLRKDANLVMTRNTLMDIAITEAAKKRPGLEALKEVVDGQCAIVTTDMNPFKLFRAMEATKSPAPAKPGDIAPEDITIKAGETPFKPGPIVGELQKVGIPAGIENGKVVFKKDKVLVEKGKPVPDDIAKVLPRLEIFPMTVGLDLMAAFEDGLLYRRDVLNIPADYYTTMLSTASRNALALSMHIAYVTPQTITPLLAKAYREAMALSVEAAYPTKDNIKILLAKADAQMAALARKTDGLEDERLKKRI
ncbi:MAG: 50S ribosomal protein L10 [Methanomassiliicoccales archaeon]|nr:MAG: 50S ribosomal protein L10 [Methanomassiliicoccales archaeon]